MAVGAGEVDGMTSLASLRKRVGRLQRARAQVGECWCWPVLVEIERGDPPAVQAAKEAEAVAASGCECGKPMVVIVALDHSGPD